MPNRERLMGALVAALLACTPSSALGAAPHSPDNLAPPDAPAHWLPPEPWIYNHWLPFDEQRLYRVLHITRVQLWTQLRDDRRSLAGLAARHGFPNPRVLARRLVTGRSGLGRGVARAELERRAARVITQGHLAQHVFFHSLHQFAIPSAAPEIFGVSDAAFRELRRRELSPLAVGRLHGRTPGFVQGQSIAVLRERIAAGVGGGDVSATQAHILLRRQLTQLPRWLDQARYNGPPVTHRGALVQKPRDYASNPAISRDGRVVAYEAYRQKLPLAVKLGEIAVLRADVDAGTTSLVSRVRKGDRNGPNPYSAYNPTISGDGGLVAYEASAGNQNFAKRYGRIGTMLCDLSEHDPTKVDRPDRSSGDSQSTYNPALAADGGLLAFQAVAGGHTMVMARDAGGATRPLVRGLRAGGDRYADPYEPVLSADGSRLAYTQSGGRVSDARSARSTVLVRDVRSGRLLSADRGGASANPGLSPDGRFVVYTSTPRGGPAGLVLRDVASGRTARIPTGGALPLDPVVADGGAVVAFAAVREGRSEIRAWTAATGTVQLVSRAAGASGAVADGWSEGPSISGDGRRVAFASSATDLDAAKRDDTRAIFVRDIAAQSTKLISDVGVAYAVGG
ncbi:MAG: hypothetical protein ABI950_00375 [Solirubrobacteraceae bacterium]